MLKILANYSDRSGATIAHINLCNLFNRKGIACEFYGPSNWHISQCNGKLISEYVQDPNDIIITHAKVLKIKPICKYLIYTHHELNNNLSKFNLHLYDHVHFVSKHQQQYCNVQYPQFVVQNVLDDLNPGQKPTEPVAGVIGRITNLKQTHISICRALDDRFKNIILYGTINDIHYYNTNVLPLVVKHKIQVRGWCEDKQQMYNSITDVYHSSLEEVKCYVIGECQLTNTNIHLLPGMSYTSEEYTMTNDEIFSIWKTKLNF